MNIEPLESRIAPAGIFALEADRQHLVSFDSACAETLLRTRPSPPLPMRTKPPAFLLSSDDSQTGLPIGPTGDLTLLEV